MAKSNEAAALAAVRTDQALVAGATCTCSGMETAWEANPKGHAVGCPLWGTNLPNRNASILTAPRERDRTFPPNVVRYSELSRMSSSPAHFRAAYEFPREPSAQMRRGTLVHSLILDGPTANDIVVFDGERGAKGWKAFREAHEGKFIVTADELADARFIAAKVRQHPLAAPLLEGQPEVEMRWKRQGIDCGGRLDVLAPHRITEVKTGFTSHPEAFARHAVRMGYHAQGAWYRFGANETGGDIYRVCVIAVEMRQPFAVTVFEMTARALEHGDRLCTLWLERFAVQLGAQSGGHWPEYAEHVCPLDVPDDVELTFGDEDEAA